VAGVAESLAAVRARLSAALAEAGRPPGSAVLVAVGKEKPAALLREAYAVGQRDFGESYAQELRDKARELADLRDVRWHFIGRLQENKAKYVAPVAALVHAVGDAGLARELARRGGGRTIRCLVQVNVGRELQKAGVAPEGTLGLCRELAALEGIDLAGLMCIPPDGPPARPFFRALRELRDEVGKQLGRALPELSMGMSHDFEDAVREGATLVRVGTLIFGERS
jgi:PLP dependent protein